MTVGGSAVPGQGVPGEGQVDYLSPEWLTRADQAVSQLPPLPDPITVEIIVTGEADGATTTSPIVAGYRLILGPDRVAVRPLDTDGVERTEPDTDRVRMTMPLTVASAIAQGQAAAQRAFLDGHVQLGGDITVLLGYQRELAEIDDRMAPLRADTGFPPG